MKDIFFVMICVGTWTLATPDVALADEACDLDVNDLSGLFVGQKAGASGDLHPDKDFRILFFEEAGVRKAVSTGGRIFPSMPLTKKTTYEFVEVIGMPSGPGEALYRANLAAAYGIKGDELEQHKQTNQNFGWKLEGMLYIRVDSTRCHLKVSDMYATYIEGNRIEDFNAGGQSIYVRSDETRYSMVDCPPAYNPERPEDNRQGELVAWNRADPDPKADESYPRGGSGTTVPTGEPVHWIYIDTELTRSADCTYYLDLYIDDLPVDGKVNVPVTPTDRGTYWGVEMTHGVLEQPASIEIHRHKVCGGKDEIIDAVCNIVRTEQAE